MLDDFEKYTLPQLDLGVKLPEFNINKDYKDKYNLSDNCNSYEFLLALCVSGLEKKIGKDNPNFKQYYERMKYELSAFKELDFCSYLLITWDIVNHCIENNIAVGYGRGSAANSLVNYLIGITQIDSLKYNLYFERFLNKTRAKFKENKGIKYYDGSLLFDIDLDISYSDRDKLVRWVEEKYKNRTAKLPTVTTFTSKILVKEVAKCILEINEDKANEISESIPVEFGKVFEIDRAIKESEDFNRFAKNNEEIIDVSRKLYGLNRNQGIHASAWIITSDKLNGIIPTELSKDNKITAAYVMDDALNMAIKIDMLGLRCATLIDRVCKMVGITPNEIDVNNELIYKELQDLKTPYGLFQIEAGCNYNVLRRVKPKNLEHLGAVVALARPGALQFIDSFADYIETGKGSSLHAFFDDVLKETGFNCIYQEQAIAMAHKLGFSLAEGEILRRIIGKKKPKEMAEWKDKVYKKVKEQNLDSKIGDIFWKILEDSASYSFNKGHSISYATMSAATVYLKFKYPKEFFLTLLQLSKEEQNPVEEIRTIENELKYFGIKLLGPHILKSELDFKIEGNNIRFGLGSIKGVADKTLEKLRNFRNKYASKFDIFMAAEQCEINIGVLSSLIQAGTMDDYLSEKRSDLVLESQLWYLLTDREKQKLSELGEIFDYDVRKIMNHLTKPQNGSDIPFIKDSRRQTIYKKYSQYKTIYSQNIKNEKLANYIMEKNLIGYSYTSDLHSIISHEFPDLIKISEIKNEVNDQFLFCCGEVLELRNSISKNKNKYVKCKISDGTETIDVLLFEHNFAKNDALNNDNKIEVGNIVVCEGNKKTNSIFCNKIIIQDIKVYLKFSDIKNIKIPSKSKDLVDKM